MVAVRRGGPDDKPRLNYCRHLDTLYCSRIVMYAQARDFGFASFSLMKRIDHVSMELRSDASPQTEKIRQMKPARRQIPSVLSNGQAVCTSTVPAHPHQ